MLNSLYTSEKKDSPKSIMPFTRSKRWQVKVKGNKKRNHRWLRKNKTLVQEQENEEI